MHDRKGNPVKVGDIVSIPARVTETNPGAQTCNIHVELLEPNTPDGPKEGYTLTARQVEVTDSAPAAGRNENAVEAEKVPVQAARSQDASPDSNDGRTVTTEHGKPVAPVGSSL